jgi:hypothetical protein
MIDGERSHRLLFWVTQPNVRRQVAWKVFAARLTEVNRVGMFFFLCVCHEAFLTRGHAARDARWGAYNHPPDRAFS